MNLQIESVWQWRGNLRCWKMAAWASCLLRCREILSLTAFINTPAVKPASVTPLRGLHTKFLVAYFKLHSPDANWHSLIQGKCRETTTNNLVAMVSIIIIFIQCFPSGSFTDWNSSSIITWIWRIVLLLFLSKSKQRNLLRNTCPVLDLEMKPCLLFLYWKNFFPSRSW